MRRADIIVGTGLIILSAWFFWYASAYRKATIYYYGPNFFPQILSIMMSLCAVSLIVKAIRGDVLPQEDRIDPKGFIRMMVAIGMCIGYLLIMQVIGFAMGTCVFLFALMTFLGYRDLIKRIASSVVSSLIVWAVFRYFLIIPLPTGIFSFSF